jgi:hypothetical protein
MSTIRDVYLTEFKTMPYKERLYYLLNNEVVITKPCISINPLYWCAIDLINAFKFCITLALYPIIFALAMNEARLLKARYEKEDRCSFFSKRKMIK